MHKSYGLGVKAVDIVCGVKARKEEENGRGGSTGTRENW